MAFTPEFRAKAEATLRERGATNPCTRCGHTTFGVLDGLFAPFLNQEPVALCPGSPCVPMVVAACTNCGHTWMHAVGVLGLMKDLKPDDNPTGKCET